MTEAKLRPFTRLGLGILFVALSPPPAIRFQRSLFLGEQFRVALNPSGILISPYSPLIGLRAIATESRTATCRARVSKNRVSVRLAGVRLAKNHLDA